MKIQTVGSVCSGIEAASVAWKPLGFEFKWFSEIADFPSKLLNEKYPSIPNLGDMSVVLDKQGDYNYVSYPTKRFVESDEFPFDSFKKVEPTLFEISA